MPNVLVQVKADIHKAFNNIDTSEQNSFLSILENQILELSKADQKVRQLVSK